MLNAGLRKVKGDNNDQWNDRADAPADTGRDEALAWPQCSFEVVMPTGTVPFRKTAMRSDWGLAEVRAQLVTETDILLPGWRELKVCKSGNRYDGARTDGGHQLFHSSLLPACGWVTNELAACGGFVST
jgi:hypothetical protein